MGAGMGSRLGLPDCMGGTWEGCVCSRTGSIPRNTTRGSSTPRTAPCAGHRHGHRQDLQGSRLRAQPQPWHMGAHVRLAVAGGGNVELRRQALQPLRQVL